MKILSTIKDVGDSFWFSVLLDAVAIAAFATVAYAVLCVVASWMGVL